MKSANPKTLVRDDAATARLLKMLADATRLRICRHLMTEGETNVGDLCEVVGMPQPAVSHHLAWLRMAGLVECRRAGKSVVYSMAEGHPAAAILRAIGGAA